MTNPGDVPAATSTEDSTPALPPATHEPIDVIDTPEEFADAVAALHAGHGPIAVDAERASGFRYSQRAYLLQFYRRGAGTFLFDPPAIGDFSALQAAISDEEWVFHAASQDLPCLREVGLDPKRIFDTELGARLLGLPRVGLGTVVADLLGVTLEKAHSAADWSKRPLPQDWLLYAALDVSLLVDLRDKIADLLAEAGKLDLAQQEFEYTLHKELRPQREDPWRRLSGIHQLRKQRQLAVARELWLARDAYAAAVDIAPGRLVPDRSLLAAAATLPQSRAELLALKEFNGRASHSESARWWAAIERGLTTEDLPPMRTGGDVIPPPRAWSDRNPDADRRLTAAKAVLTELSETREIPMENLLTPDTLRRLAWEPPTPLSVESLAQALRELEARPWQIDLLAEPILSAFVEGNQASQSPAATAVTELPNG